MMKRAFVQCSTDPSISRVSKVFYAALYPDAVLAASTRSTGTFDTLLRVISPSNLCRHKKSSVSGQCQTEDCKISISKRLGKPHCSHRKSGRRDLNSRHLPWQVCSAFPSHHAYFEIKTWSPLPSVFGKDCSVFSRCTTPSRVRPLSQLLRQFQAVSVGTAIRAQHARALPGGDYLRTGPGAILPGPSHSGCLAALFPPLFALHGVVAPGGTILSGCTTVTSV
jgi:hypothetical protein